MSRQEVSTFGAHLAFDTPDPPTGYTTVERQVPEPLLSTLSRWVDRETGELLVAVAVKDDEGVRSVLPVQHYPMMTDAYQAAHPFDWMPEATFLRRYELASPSQTEGAGP